MYTLNIARAIKKMSINEIRDIREIFENYYKQNGFSKENSYYTLKRLKKKRSTVARKKNNIKKYLILIMLKNTINLL